VHNVNVLAFVLVAFVHALVFDVVLIRERVVDIPFWSKHHLHRVMKSCVQDPCNRDFGQRGVCEPIPKGRIPVPKNIKIVDGAVICRAKPSDRETISVENQRFRMRVHRRRTLVEDERMSCWNLGRSRSQWRAPR
jgi:hypothetical protein